MEAFSPHFFVLTLAMVGVVIMVAALLSGLIDRSDVPQVGVFLALGAIFGPAGLLWVVATLSLGAGAVYRRGQLEHRRGAPPSAVGFSRARSRHSVSRRADRSRRVGLLAFSLPAAVTIGARVHRPRDAPRSIETSRFAGGS